MQPNQSVFTKITVAHLHLLISDNEFRPMHRICSDDAAGEADSATHTMHQRDVTDRHTSTGGRDTPAFTLTYTKKRRFVFKTHTIASSK